MTNIKLHLFPQTLQANTWIASEIKSSLAPIFYYLKSWWHSPL